ERAAGRRGFPGLSPSFGAAQRRGPESGATGDRRCTLCRPGRKRYAWLRRVIVRRRQGLNRRRYVKLASGDDSLTGLKEDPRFQALAKEFAEPADGSVGGAKSKPWPRQICQWMREEMSMCLGIPGKVVETYREHNLLMGKVDFGGVCKRICL